MPDRRFPRLGQLAHHTNSTSTHKHALRVALADARDESVQHFCCHQKLFPQRGNRGHLRVACREDGCRSTWYFPPHEPGT
jgi:hypothetical protein